jgi:hypothetical protein
MAETLILDPNEVATGRVSFDITSYVGEAGPDWGDAAIEQFLADVQLGQIPVDFRLPNRTITIPLLLRTDPLVSFETLRKRVQQKAGLFQREGGWVKRQTALGPLFAEVTGAQLKLGGSTAQALWGIDADAVLTLTTLPDWYGNEVVGDLQTAVSGTGELVFTLLGGQSALFNQTLLASTPALYWRLGANGLVDQSGNTRNGAAAGGVTVGGVTGALADDNDAATDFDGSNDAITSTYNPFTNGTTRTFAGVAWRDTTGSDTLVGSDSATSAQCVVLRTSGLDVLFSVDGNTTFQNWSGAWSLIGRWVHWSLVFNETTDTAELFINGISKGTKTVTQAYNASPGNLKLGAYGPTASGPFNGKMDEFAVWTRALTAAEILTLARHSVGRGVGGELPARARLVLTETSGQDLHGLLWGVRSRNYSSAATGRLSYEAEALTPIAPAVSAANASASNGNEVVISAVAKDWTAVLSTDLAGTGSLDHVGSYRVWARVRTAATVLAPKVRLAWDVGDLLQPIANDLVRLPLATDYWMADLGEIRLNPAPIGTHRWQGVIQVADTDGGAFGIDKLLLQPLDEAAGRLSVSSALTVGMTGYSARDEFDQTAGALTAKTLPVGGTWTYATGDTDDFTVDATNHRAQRSTTSDTAARLMYASTPSLAAVAIQVDFFHQVPLLGGNQEAWLFFRYVDASNYGFVRMTWGVGSGSYVVLGRVVGGAATNLAIPTVAADHRNAWWTLRAMVTAKGYMYVWAFPQGSTPPSKPAGSRTDAAATIPFGTGGAMASGRVGFGDYNDSSAVTRLYDNFLAWVPDVDAVLFANRGAELRHDGMFREAPGGANYAPIAVTGDLLRLPPAGLEGRTAEVFLRPSSGDFDQGADTPLSNIQAQMRYRPSYLFVPEG